MIHTLKKDSQESKDELHTFFKSKNIEVEIGVGKGRYTFEYASAHPHVLLVGIEKSIKWLKKAQEKIEKNKTENVVLLSAYVEDLFELMEDQSIHKFHILFPDPWPKKRHHKRRFVSEKNFKTLWDKLKPNGEIYLATDHEDYFTAMQEVFQKTEHLFKFEEAQSAAFMSNFQAKYLKEGRSMHFVKLKKI